MRFLFMYFQDTNKAPILLVLKLELLNDFKKHQLLAMLRQLEKQELLFLLLF